MASRILSIIFTLLLCCFPAVAQEVVEDEQEELEEVLEQQDSLEVEIPREPMLPADSLRYVVDKWLNKDNYTTTKTSYRTVKRKRKRVTVPYTVTSKRNFSVGCCIYDLTADSMLYIKNPDRMMIPASTQKLYIATAMLFKRGKSYTFNTCAYSDGLEKTDSAGRKYLDGNIYVLTSCDPTLEKATAYQILKDIESLDVDSINGQIIQCVTPKTSRVDLAEDGFAKSIIKSLERDSIGLLEHSPSIGGRLDRRMWCMSRLKTPLDDVLERMLRSSNNTYAECVLLNLCEDNDEWSYSDCKDVVREMVNKVYRKYNREKVDLSTSYYNIQDGSGLSFSNKTSARSQVDLLRFIYADKRLFNAIYPHLPRAGVTGTLSKRMTGGPAYDNVRAKTGTVRNTATLSGYVTTANKHRIAFSILINDCPDKGFARGLQDKICQLIAGLDL